MLFARTSNDLPRGLLPMLPIAAGEPFDSPNHIFEACRPGIRALAYISPGEVALQARNLADITPAFRGIARDLRATVRGDGIVLDGLIIPSDDDPAARLPVLTRRICRAGLALPRASPLVRERDGARAHFEAFDVLFKGYRPLAGLPLVQRRAVLADCVAPSAGVRLAHFEDGKGIALFEAAVRLGMEGCVAKRKDSAYSFGVRSKGWAKIAKPRAVGKVVVGGYTVAAARQSQPFGSLLVGAYDGARLRFAGEVNGGFRHEDGLIMESLLASLHAEGCPFVEPPAVDRLLYWCDPRIVVEVKFGDVTQAGRLRFPVFTAFRPDVDPSGCLMEALKWG